MNARRGLILFVALAVGAAAVWWWRANARDEILHASLPREPAFAGLSAEFAQRLSTSDQLIRRGSGGTAALAELGQLYHANGFLPEAVQCYRGLAQLDPANARWPHRLACIYAGYGQLDDGLPLWQRVIRVAPDYLPARIRMGDVLLKLNRPAEAADAYAAVLAREATNAFALTGLARIDLAAGQVAPAREKLERAASASGGRIGGDLLATACEQLGDHARAETLRARAKASGAFHDPPDPWMDEIFDDCFDVYRVTVAAGFADHAGDSARAQRLIERALKLDPKHAPALFQSGTFALQRHDLEKARQDFEACVAVAPDNSDAWARLSKVSLERGDQAAAARVLAAGLARNPDSGALLGEQARRLTAAGRHAEAAAALERAVRVRPDDADTLVRLASAYFRLERLDEGAAALRRALAAEPEHPAALTTLTMHAIGSGDEAAAREWFRHVRAQPRVPTDLAADLAGEFRRRFGREP